MQTVYDLRRLKNSKDKDITKALNIYSKNIEPILRTDTREILYWLDHYNHTHEDDFILLGLYLNGNIIGFAQLANFKSKKIVFVDYIVIDKDWRKNNTFYEFVEKIKDFLSDNIVYDYILGEVGYYNDRNEPSENTRTLIRLLKMAGFGVIKTKYYQPMLGIYNIESELQAILMIYTSNEVKKIKKETYIQFIETIYYNHYKRWYDKFLSEKEQVAYVLSLDKLYASMLSEIKKKEYIDINGYQHLYNSETTSKPSKLILVTKGLALVIIFIAFLIAFTAMHIFLKNKYGVSITAQKYILSASALSVIFIILLFLEKKTSSLSEKLGAIIKKIL